MSNLIIGLTGGIGSGKTTVANMFADLGVELIDADIIAREVVMPKTDALHAIKAHFGNDIVDNNGSLDRAKLRTKIFSNEANKEWLNNLLHPLIRSTILAKISQASGDYCILVAPLLFENNLTEYVHKTLVIDVDEPTQIARTVKRDNSDEDIIKNIIASQISRPQRLKKADDIIDNSSSDLSQLVRQVKELHIKYLDAAKRQITS